MSNFISKLRRKSGRILFPFLLHPHLRYWIGKARFIFYGRILGRINTVESKEAVKNTVQPNLEIFANLRIDFFMRRMPLLIRACLATETLNESSKILVIGPRTESDLLILKGFMYSNVVGLDLISYSPWIKLGDLHDIPFPENTFDAVICGWGLSYSNTPAKAIAEITRVTKKDGLVAIGLDHWPYHTDETKKILGDFTVEQLQDQGKRINSTAEIRELFGASLGTVFFDHDAPLKHLTPDQIEARSGLKASIVMMVNSVKKQ